MKNIKNTNTKSSWIFIHNFPESKNPNLNNIYTNKSETATTNPNLNHFWDSDLNKNSRKKEERTEANTKGRPNCFQKVKEVKFRNFKLRSRTFEYLFWKSKAGFVFSTKKDIQKRKNFLIRRCFNLRCGGDAACWPAATAPDSCCAVGEDEDSSSSSFLFFPGTVTFREREREGRFLFV